AIPLQCPVGHHDEAGLVAEALLPDAVDADAVVGKGLRHPGQHTRPVVDLQQDVVRGRGLVHVTDPGVLSVARAAHAAAAAREVAGQVDDVAHHGGTGG